MKFLFVMDPLSTVVPEKDTSFGFIDAAQQLGHSCFHALVHDVGARTTADGPVPHATMRKLVVEGGPAVEKKTIRLDGDAEQVPLSELDAVFIRKDPPFDGAYLYLTLCLEYARGGPVLINDPRGLRDANEKLYALHFAKWMPTTAVTSDREAILSFMKEVGGRAVVKPLDGAGGAGVMMIREGDKNNRAIVDALTLEGKRLAMVQAFVPDVTTGDKRILLLDGEPLGAILRVPRGDDLRSNIHVGGSVVPTALTERERALVADIAPRLKRDGLHFVGLDVIGEHLTEVNVTSPTGIQELSKFEKTNKSELVIRWAEGLRTAAH